jgi:hypothetical protein
LTLTQEVEGLALIGRRDELAPLHAQTEALVDTGVVTPGSFTVLAQTTAGITATAAGRFEIAEARFRIGMDHADAQFALARPYARLWYADMLIQRGAPGDRQRAGALLEEAIAIADGYGLVTFEPHARSLLRT